MSLKISTYNDEELVTLYREKDIRAAVGELFKRHSLMCFTVCMKYLKDEDAAQDASMNIFENLFRDLKQHHIQNFRSWLHTVCRNYCLMELRKPQLTSALPNFFEENEDDFMQWKQLLHPIDEAEDKEAQLQVLEQSLQELNEKQRICIELFYLKSNSYEQVSNLTGMALNEVKSNIQNGKRNLKIALKNKGVIMALIWVLWMC